MKKNEESIDKSIPDAQDPSRLSDGYNIEHDEPTKKTNEIETKKISKRLYPKVVYQVTDTHGRVLCMDQGASIL